LPSTLRGIIENCPTVTCDEPPFVQAMMADVKARVQAAIAAREAAVRGSPVPARAPMPSPRPRTKASTAWDSDTCAPRVHAMHASASP